MINTKGHVGIVSEKRGRDPAGQAPDIRDHVTRFDCVIAFSKDPSGTCIEANRYKEVRAIECREGEDIKAAKVRSRANTFVFDDSISRSSVQGLVLELLDGAPPVKKADPKQKNINEKQMQDQKNEKAKKKEEEKDDDSNDDEKMLQPPKSGFMKKMKYTFGLD
jgi:hypothetical protein